MLNNKLNSFYLFIFKTILLVLACIIFCSSNCKINCSKEPKLVPLINHIDKDEGANLTQVCMLESGDKANLDFKWFKNSKEIWTSKDGDKIKFEKPKQTEADYYLIRIYNLTSDDSGNYTCQVSNSHGIDKTSSILKVRIPLKFIEIPANNYTVGVGGSLHVPCRTNGERLGHYVVWRKLRANKDTIGSDSEEQSDTFIQSHELKFKSISLADSGLYECVAVDQYNKQIRALTSIQIKALIFLTFSLRVQLSFGLQGLKIAPLVASIERLEATNLTLYCNIEAKDTSEIQSRWLKNGIVISDKQIGTANKYKLEKSASGETISLKIFNLTSDDSASYTCESKDKSQGFDSQTTKLNVKLILRWIEEPKPKYKLAIGNSLMIPCKSSGHSQGVSWYKLAQDKDQVDEKISLGDELYFKSLTLANSGLYECKTSDHYGKELKALTYVEVMGK